MYGKAFTHRIKEIAASIGYAIAIEHGESFPPEQIEQAVKGWLENRLEDLADDAVELLTEPRFGYANDFYSRIAKNKSNMLVNKNPDDIELKLDKKGKRDKPMSNLPKRIEETSLCLNEKTQAISELRERIAEIEAIETLAIANAKTTEGKPQFSNESTRNAELVIRLRQNQDAVELKQMLARCEQERAQLLVRLERLRGNFKVALIERQGEIAAKSTPFINMN